MTDQESKELTLEDCKQIKDYLNDKYAESKELKHKGNANMEELIKDILDLDIFELQKISIIKLMRKTIQELWEENQHLRDWTRKNIKEESEWATKYMQTKAQLLATEQALDTAREALDYIADAQFVWLNDEIVDEESLRPLREIVIKALTSIKE